MNPAIEIKNNMSALYTELSSSRAKFDTAQFKVNQAEMDLKIFCNHKNNNGTTAIKPSTNWMFDEWGTCQICKQYLEY